MDSFIPFGYTMAILIFGFVIYLVLSMPTKRDLRKATHPDVEARRSAGLAAELRARKGARCRLLLGACAQRRPLPAFAWRSVLRCEHLADRGHDRRCR